MCALGLSFFLKFPSLLHSASQTFSLVSFLM
ncbi:hypothetical protein CSUI_004632 [Cystoisospora suis]|uniref:Uncharacterized protein n=1 Tax=Cystoisospora suis TaxID=483139 RepID=A0A2C6L0V3_9APIC|nr:hypothetical protein CSUI_004632 [Cystoisospora suis]